MKVHSMHKVIGKQVVEWVNFGGDINLPRQNTQPLEIARPPTGKHSYSDHQDQLVDIAAFLNHMEWAPATEANPAGITWIELFALFGITGWNWCQTREGQRQKLREQWAIPDAATNKWKAFLSSKGSKLKAQACAYRERKSCRAELDHFKRLTRFLIRRTISLGAALRNVWHTIQGGSKDWGSKTFNPPSGPHRH